MADHVLTARLHLAAPRDRVFDFFSRAENLGRITPPEMAFRILTPLPIEMCEGALIDYRIGLHGIPMTWRTRITRWVPGVSPLNDDLAALAAEMKTNGQSAVRLDRI